MNFKEESNPQNAEHHDASLPNVYAKSSSFILFQGLVS